MIQKPFTHIERDLRIRLGDTLVEDIRDEVERLGASSALVICSPGRQDQVAELERALGDLCAGIFAEAVQHVPRASIEAATQAYRTSGADCCIAVGGGSPIGLGKALALEADSPMPLIAMPTTYSGSEATAIWGISDDGRKTTGRDLSVAPATILYVPRWTTGLPRGLSAASGVNAMAHCVEALYAVDRTPMTSLMSVESIRAFASALPRIMEAPDDLDARAEALWGAYLAGRALDAASLGLHHKICHVLGGSFNTPHAPTHAVVLPYATAYNSTATPEAMSSIATALGDADQGAVDQLYALNRTLGIPENLQAFGIERDDLDQIADEILEKEYPNPREVERDSLMLLLEDVWTGRAPRDAY